MERVLSRGWYHLSGSLAWVSLASYGPIRFLTPYLAERPVLLVFPRSMPFDRFECEEPVWKGGNSTFAAC